MNHDLRQTAHRWLGNAVIRLRPRARLTASWLLTVVQDIYLGFVTVWDKVVPGLRSLGIWATAPVFGVLGCTGYLIAAFESGAHQHMPWWGLELMIGGAIALSAGSTLWYRRHAPKPTVHVGLFGQDGGQEILNLDVSMADAMFIKRWLEGHHAYQPKDDGSGQASGH